MALPRSASTSARLVGALAALLVALGLVVAPATATTPPDDATTLTLPPTGTSDGEPDTAPDATAPGTTVLDNDFVDLERDLTDCVGNANPKPGCGREPTHSGDRGSGMQLAIFGLMAAGIGFIGWRIVAGGRRQRSSTPTT